MRIVVVGGGGGGKSGFEREEVEVVVGGEGKGWRKRDEGEFSGWDEGRVRRGGRSEWSVRERAKEIGNIVRRRWEGRERRQETKLERTLSRHQNRSIIVELEVAHSHFRRRSLRIWSEERDRCWG